MMSDLICFISPINFFKDFLGVFCLLVEFSAGILINENTDLPGIFLEHHYVFVSRTGVTCLDLSSL